MHMGVSLSFLRKQGSAVHRAGLCKIFDLLRITEITKMKQSGFLHLPGIKIALLIFCTPEL
jgi:hypothetical protein